MKIKKIKKKGMEKVICPNSAPNKWKRKTTLDNWSVSPTESCSLSEQVEFQGMNYVQIYRAACEPAIQEYTDGKA